MWPIAQVLFVLLITSCATGRNRGSPTPPALPGFPAITPIVPEQDPSATAEPTPTVTPTIEPSPQTEGSAVHTVQPGDTLLGLAKQYGVPMAAIQLENDMGSSTVLQAGQTLIVPSSEAWPAASPFWIVYQVESGETLTAIAQRFDLELDPLMAVNGLEDADRIGAGQLLTLPLRGPTALVVPGSTPPQDADVTPPSESTSAQPATDVPQATATLTSAVAPSPDPTGASPPAQLSSWPREIARLINDVRSQHGLPPLSYNETLEQAAQAHANDCARRGWCGHTGSDGADIRSRITRAGYQPAGWAECWAQTQTPERAVEVWMDETPPNDPHRRTLLSDWLTEVGLGISEADWGRYIIADFGRP